MNEPRKPLGEPVDTSSQHLDDWTLGQLAEGMLSGTELSSATEHVEACGQCADELAGYRALYAALSDMPRHAPSPAFNDAVMARVRLAQPSPVWAWIQGWLPTTRRGWTILGAALVAPALPLIGMMAWVLTHPGVSMGSLWQTATTATGSFVAAAFDQVIDWGLSSGVFGWVQLTVESALSLPLPTVAGVFALLGIAIPLSAWSLYRLIREPMGNATYAN